MNLYITRRKKDGSVLGLSYAPNIIQVSMKIQKHLNPCEFEVFRLAGFKEFLAFWDFDLDNDNWSPNQVESTLRDGYFYSRGDYLDKSNPFSDLDEILNLHNWNRLEDKRKRHWIDLSYLYKKNEELVLDTQDDFDKITRFTDRKIISMFKETIIECNKKNNSKILYEPHPYLEENPIKNHKYYILLYSKMLNYDYYEDNNKGY